MPATAERNEALEAIGKATLAAIVAPLVFAFLIALSLPLTVYSAFVLQHFWTWFGAPFTSQPPPPLFVLAGAILAIRLATIKLDRRGNTDEENKVQHGFGRQAVQHIIIVSILWLCGYILHLLAGWYA